MKWLYVLTLCVALVASENPDENEDIDDPDLYEGDMILTPGQRMAIEMGLDVNDPLGRAASTGPRWPRGVMTYVLESSLSRNARARSAIWAGMEEWQKKSCIRVKKRTNEKDYVYFKPGGGCSSYVGRIGGRQDITLASGCWTKGIVAHEVGHALGFWHEQSRPDRDKYVTIIWKNIQAGKAHNFFKRKDINSLGFGYDYWSVMHYGPTAFSKNRQPTIVPKRKGVKIGQRKGISGTDARQMNKLYKWCKS